MKVVGDHLSEEALRRGDPTEFDLFGRSAFNRYYYSAFLSIRSVLKTIDPAWGRPKHKTVPDILLGDVLKRIREAVRKLEKAGILSNTRGKQLVTTASTSASELSYLLKSAYETRRLADYEPEIRVTHDGTNSKLGSWTLTKAQNWESRVNAQSKTILNIYAELGLI